jgi:regulator of protease activity HflC (stomatin/prohibitin superfamily)
MLYKFKSRAAPDLIMLEPNGRRVLQLIGKPVDAKQGILQPADMPAAIAALEAAIAQEEAERRAAEAEAAAQGEELPEPEGVSLRQRATPFIDMLRRCLKADKEIVWGV